MEPRRLSVGDWIIATLFGGTIVVVAAQVIWRYVFNASLVWTEELSRYLFTWIIFIGAALAIKEATHIRIGFLVDRLPPTVAAFVNVFHLVLMVACLAFIVGVGFQWVVINADTRTPALGLPLNYVFYAALPVASLLGVYFGVRQLVSIIRGKTDTQIGSAEEA